ncbi:AAA family ATPase [Oenococcus oeni]|uniref:AAA family ATPase n=1 Tax=Oenococcus oeni TaxID=1247 RepID=A0AAJ2UBH4_OENOE|nr:DUF4435 domain-containing protein [Oenococcus oeni]MDV7715295.1 AAA family ATPase [Oenococcus oeni]
MLLTLSAEETINNFLNDIKVEKEKSNDSSYSKSLISIESKANDVLTELKGEKISHIFSLRLDDFRKSTIGLSVDRLKNEVTSVHFTKEGVDNNNLLNQMKKILNDFKIIKYLFDFSQHKKNIVICGPNGSGKSAFASFLKSSYLSNLIVLPAQKFLYYMDLQSYQNKTIEDYVKVEQKDSLKIVRDGEPFDINNPENLHFSVSQDLMHRFTIAINALVNNHVEIALEDRKKNKKSGNTFLEEVQDIWNSFFPNIELFVDQASRVLRAKNVNSEQEYYVNSLSDGEKSCLYYLASIFTAPKNSFVVVDEPETYMNPAIYNKLWDILVNRRNDCQFIFISHNKDFISSRINFSILWIKNFNAPDSWNLEEISDQNNIPIDLLVSLVGSSKDIIFCEGSASSWDNKLYSQLFINDKTIIPVGGHDQVIEYTKAVTRLSKSLNVKAFGIIDGDGRSDEEMESLSKKNVLVLPFNEIEMVFFDEDIVKSVLEPFNKMDNFSKFKNALFVKLEEKKNQIILNILVDEANYRLENEKICNRNSVEEIRQNLTNTYSSINNFIEKNYNELENKINCIISTNDYYGALKICNLKGEVAYGIADRELDNSFLERALTRIEIDDDLRKKIRDKYFKKIS